MTTTQLTVLILIKKASSRMDTVPIISAVNTSFLKIVGISNFTITDQCADHIKVLLNKIPE